MADQSFYRHKAAVIAQGAVVDEFRTALTAAKALMVTAKAAVDADTVAGGTTTAVNAAATAVAALDASAIAASCYY